MIYLGPFMDKTFLSLFFCCFVSSPGFAEPVPTIQILDYPNKVEIQFHDSNGYVEAPSITIVNSADHCQVNANETGASEFMAELSFFDNQHVPRAVQVVSAVFENCRIYFGRVRSLNLEKNEPQSVLLGVRAREEKVFEVSYKGSSIETRLKQLSLDLLEASRSSQVTDSSDTSLVLLRP